jgi:ABC-type glutathione transport system ATPase component
MARLRSGRTSFVIAHRLSAIRNADSIVVMDAGRIVEVSSHADLLARHGFYYTCIRATSPRRTQPTLQRRLPSRGGRQAFAQTAHTASPGPPMLRSRDGPGVPAATGPIEPGSCQ